MSTIDIKPILEEAGEQIKTLALQSGIRYKDEVIAAGQKILTGMQGDLARWVPMVASDQMTPAEFTLLAKSYKTELAMSGLQQAGMAHVRSAELGLEILNIIISVALSLLKKI